MDPTLKRALIWAGLLVFVWPTQYLLVSPARWTWRLCAKVARGLALSAVGVILLLCLPIIGWLILILALVLRGKPAPRGSINAGLWTPWLVRYAH